MTSEVNWWTPHEIRILIAMWSAGVSTTEIGKELNRTNRSIIGKAGRLNLIPHVNTMPGGRPGPRRLVGDMWR